MKKLIVKGQIEVVCNYNTGDGLYVGRRPLSEQLEDIQNKQVSVNFYITDIEKPIEELKENLILQLCGAIDADYGDAYSDLTGYLWTDDKLQIGNHDIIEMLSEHDGKFVYLDITIH